MKHYRTGTQLRRIALAAGMILVALVVQNSQLTPERVDASATGPSSPAQGSGTETAPFVRVLDGKSFEAYLNGVQVAVVIVGIDVPPGGSACGQEATRQLTALARGGLTLEEDSTIAFDAAHRRVYSATTRDGRVVAEELVKAGVAKVNGVGEPRHQYLAVEADARAAKRGCLWNGGQAPPAPAASGAPKAAGAAATLPVGFRQDVIATSINAPTGIAFAPGNRIFVTEKAGRVRVVENGILLTAPLIDIANRVNNYGDRGLIGMAVDPNFASNGYLYLMYTFEDDPNTYDGPKTVRVARYTAVGDSASPGSEVVILGAVRGSSCDNFPAGTDIICSDGSSHSAGSLRFASDGTLFVSFGDGASFSYVDDDALRSQNVDILAGKLLHVTSAGLGVPGNPFWNGDARANRSKVWAYGFRNPFRFQLRPGSDTPYIGDVGWNTWEEIDVGVKGGNYGWPCYEGREQQSGYASKPLCQALYNRGAGAVQFPLTTYNHNGLGAAVAGGTFYTGTSYPARYRGAYFYADYALSVIRTLTVDGNNTLTGGPTDFATNTDGPVDFATGPDGDIYYASVNTGELRHIVYTIAPQPVIPRASADVVKGGAPLTVHFSSTGSTGPSGVTLTYDWEFDDGTPGTSQPNPTHTYTAPGVYDPVLYAYDGSGATPVPTSVIEIRVGTPPTPTITAPSPSLTFAIGDTINFAGSATDPVDGSIPGPQLNWEIVQHHCPGGICHTHHFLNLSDTGGSFTIPDHGDDVYYEIILTAVDAAGLTGTTSVIIHPKTVHLTLTTSPPGGQVVYGGTAYTAPVTVITYPGSVRTISTGSAQNFDHWSDGGARQHDITIGTTDSSYTAVFSGPIPVAGLQYYPLAKPVRLLDTRVGAAAFVAPGAPLSAGQTLTLPGQFSYQGVAVPAAARAIVGNATVANGGNGTPAGFATLFPSGVPLPLTSNLNFVSGTVRPNAFTVALGADTKFDLYSSSGGDFVVDISGYYAPAGAGGLYFHPLSAPVRELDTRKGSTALVHPDATLTAGQTVNLPGSFTFNGVTVPASAQALVGNATVANDRNGTPAGYATLYPGGVALPLASNLNFVPGTVAPNAFTTALGGDGTYNLYTSSGGDFVVDITGYLDTTASGGLLFTPLSAPVRELDTRKGSTALVHPDATLTAGQTVNLPGSFTFNGVTVPASAQALVGNATVANDRNGTPAGYATLYPGGVALPLASNLNFVPGTVAPNAFTTALGGDGTYNLYTSSGGDFVVDITGYFAAPGAASVPA